MHGTLAGKADAMTAIAPSGLTRHDAETFLYREARLLDTWQLEAWLDLFTKDGTYWIPIDDAKPPSRNTSMIHDTRLRREERVFHLLNHRFASQTPRSRTVHLISNVEVEQFEPQAYLLRSNQMIYEVRAGDFRQVGLGDVRPLVATVEHRVVVDRASSKILSKKILLIDRDMTQYNLTFII